MATLPNKAQAQAEALFINVWGIHRQDATAHDTVLKACREALQKTDLNGQATLGAYSPVVKTLEAWHLLQQQNNAAAVASFQAALNRQNSSDFIVRSADTMAKRWLSRIDRERVVAALKTYYADNVAYPTTLAPLQGLPDNARPPARDRLGDPWGYKLEELRRIKNVNAQRYTLYSLTIGRKTSTLATALKDPYPTPPLLFVSKTGGDKALIELRTAPTSPPAILSMGNRSGAYRLVALDRAGRFALLCDDDYWVTALPQSGGAR